MNDEQTSTLESLDTSAATTPEPEPLRLLRAAEIRARRRPRAIAFVWLWELASAIAIATPVQTWGRAVWGRHPDGDAPIFRPGGQDLLAWVQQPNAPLGIVVRTTLIALFFVTLFTPLVNGALTAALTTVQGKRAPSAISSLKIGLVAYFPVLVVTAATVALQGIVLGAGLAISSKADHGFAETLGDARSFLVRLAILAVFVALVLVIGVGADLLRAAVVRAVVADPEATALEQLRRALPRALATAGRYLGRATFAWAWRAALSLAAVVAGSLLGDLVGGRGGAVLGGLFAAHQALILGRAALRASWIAHALRLL